MTETQSYGKALPDQVDRLASLSDAQIDLLDDIRGHFTERVALEREYATKLQLLIKKISDKKSRKMSALVLGTEPTKAWDDNTVRQSTIDQAYSQFITSMTDTAMDHLTLADSLSMQVADELKATSKRHEDTKKKQVQYFQKVLAERDRTYADRIKYKQKYDEQCTEVELYRQKQERSADDRHAERAAKQYEQQQADMQNSKNVYLIGTAVANSVKAKFFADDLPAIQDEFQELQTQLVSKFAKIMIHAQALEGSHLERLKTRVAAAEHAFTSISPAQDQNLFIEHNIRSFSAPPDWVFEPCGTYYDTPDMSVEPAPKVYLQNRLTRCRQKLEELRPVLQSKRQEVEKLGKLVPAYAQDHSLGNVDEVSDGYLESHHQLTSFATSECILTTEIETISQALNGDEGAQCPHTFKSASFSIPTQCGYCKSTIWGLSKQGKTCKACGISVHSKCELKVPADCPGSQGGMPRGSSHPSTTSALEVPSSRTPSTISTSVSRASSVSVTPTASSFAQTDSSINSAEEHLPSARVVFDYTPTSPFELAITEGQTVRILEEDDGSGWIKVGDSSGGSGLVPASYIEVIADEPVSAPPSPIVPSINRATKPQLGPKKKYGNLYDYQAQGPDEMSIQEGQQIELTNGPSGGTNYSDDWWEGKSCPSNAPNHHFSFSEVTDVLTDSSYSAFIGIDSSGKKGIFPSNYVEAVL
ncbi:hypothetical protein EIP91_005803 [Steccherinum ochraceum]|uniref:Uncharacterized protein n=1 Tax=Steccherinum ochraceum TaxID=92696 RepID=A0A4V2MVT0_9APHY|nr:hypothetical protein EIP91_005803 [Steccherinum ochraceum]